MTLLYSLKVNVKFYVKKLNPKITKFAHSEKSFKKILAVVIFCYLENQNYKISQLQKLRRFAKIINFSNQIRLWDIYITLAFF